MLQQLAPPDSDNDFDDNSFQHPTSHTHTDNTVPDTNFQGIPALIPLVCHRFSILSPRQAPATVLTLIPAQMLLAVIPLSTVTPQQLLMSPINSCHHQQVQTPPTCRPGRYLYNTCLFSPNSK